MARLTEQPHVLSGIVFQNHADMILAVVILLDALDSRNLAVEGDIHDISAGTRPQTHATASRHLNSENIEEINHGLLFEELPLPLVHWISSLAGAGFAGHHATS